MKKNILVVFLICFYSCSNVKRTPKPDILYGKEKMAAILADLYLLEGAVSGNQQAFLETKSDAVTFIYKKHDLDSIVFQENISYYTDRPAIFQVILESTEKRLIGMRKKLEERQSKDLNILKEQKTNSNKTQDTITAAVLESMIPKQ